MSKESRVSCQGRQRRSQKLPCRTERQGEGKKGALAKDKLYPFIGFFSKGHGANNDPVRGYMLVFLISLGCILIAQLNSIAPMLSNFFLAAYALINFSVFHASVSKSPGWRPAFKYYNAWVSLVGTLLCIAVMFLMSWWMALVTFFVVITLYLYVSYRKPDVNWGSSTQAHSYNSALKSLIELNRVELHVKNYRPQILALTGLPGDRPPLVDFANLITKGLSLLLCADIVKGNHSQRAHDALTRKAYHWFTKHRVKAFFTLTEGDFEPSARAFMQMCGLGKFRPNMLLMGYKSDWQTCDKEDLRQYFNIIHYALDRYLAVGILRLQEGLDYSKLIQDEEFVPISSIDKKAEEEKIRRNQSTGQLAQVEVVSEVPDSPCCSPLLEMDPEVITPEPLPESVVCGVKPSKSKKKNKNIPDMYLGPSGEPLSEVMWDQITRFRRKQDKGCIDVWWLYDDGGLTLLIPYILSTRSQFSGCKLRIFSLAHNKNELDKDQRNLAALLSKFRIDYSDVIVIPDIGKKATEETKKEFASLIENFRGDASDAGECRNKEQAQPLANVASKVAYELRTFYCIVLGINQFTYIRDYKRFRSNGGLADLQWSDVVCCQANGKAVITKTELHTLREKTNRHMRIRELLLQYSVDSTFVVMALPIPRRGVVSAPLYLAWLELLTKGMPPYLILRGNQTSVLTFYS
uniref:Uncharacterized protein n=1 Tax=Timema genevievae TaxID=629358 RepID=A0A7R9JX39_TIMGE|nr:unnamed protein product [Timema genevievae]